MPGSAPNPLPERDARVVLLLARPGHELFVHGWMEQLRPLVLMLTDGAGHRGSTALASATNTVRSTGARIGNLFGRFTDRGLLQSLLIKNHDRFVALAEELADLLVAEGISWLIGEAGELHDPGADVCRILLDTASGLVGRRLGNMRNYDFTPRQDRRETESSDVSRRIEIELAGENWRRKRQAILSTPGMGHWLQRSAEEVESLKREVLQVASPWQLLRFGESEGAEYAPRPDSVSIRFREHVVPLAETLRLMAAGGRAVA